VSLLDVINLTPSSPSISRQHRLKELARSLPSAKEVHKYFDFFNNQVTIFSTVSYFTMSHPEVSAADFFSDMEQDSEIHPHTLAFVFAILAQGHGCSVFHPSSTQWNFNSMSQGLQKSDSYGKIIRSLVALADIRSCCRLGSTASRIFLVPSHSINNPNFGYYMFIPINVW
jgi:hypothetical protein